jgi:recombination protein RecR
MSGSAGAVDRLIDAFGRLPGLGAKSAERLAYHLLKAPAEEALALAEAIRAVKESVRHCEVCYHLTEADVPRCSICRDPRRDHVLLGRLAPAQGVGPDQLTVEALARRVRAGGIRELIMATNPTLEGDGTALLVANTLADTGVAITRLARGLASGSVLEFANKEMLADAINGRQRF